LSVACPVRGRWGRLQAAIFSELEKTTLADLAREATEKTETHFQLENFSLSRQVQDHRPV
jgi:DNA-binding IscR family transcriptional regulator